MRSSTARSSGAGSRSSGSACTGIVDQRFDHIDSGDVVADRARARTSRRPSMTCTSRPQTPAERPLADRRRPSPSSSGTSDRPCVRCARRRRRTRRRAWRAGRRSWSSASHVAAGSTPGHATSSGMWPERLVDRDAGLAPDVASRRGSGRGRCTRSPRCRPTAPLRSSASSTRPNQWSIIVSLAP